MWRTEYIALVGDGAVLVQSKDSRGSFWVYVGRLEVPIS